MQDKVGLESLNAVQPYSIFETLFSQMKGLTKNKNYKEICTDNNFFQLKK